MKDVAHISLKGARVKTAMVVALWGLAVAWSPARAVGQCCGDCNGDGKVTVDELIKAATRELDGCQDDGVCRAQPGGQRFPASGQTTAYGPGSDGDLQAGATLSYTDNGDGTITDNNTGLMWEKKDDSGGIHDKDNTYTWGMTDAPYTMSGTMVTEFLATLNAGGGFAGHTDWRIPNVRELQSVVDYEIPYPGPTVNAAFNTAGCTGCTDVRLASCSCTANGYWSSTTYRNTPDTAWGVQFENGDVYFVYGDLGGGGGKRYGRPVRAVRGGDAPNESEQDRENRVREAASSFYAAFSSNTFDSWAPNFTTEDWNHISPGGGLTQGRDNTLTALREVHSTFLSGVTDTVEDMAVRFATCDVAVVTTTSRLTTYTTPDGVQHLTEQQRKTFVVVKRSGRWLVMQTQLTIVLGG